MNDKKIPEDDVLIDRLVDGELDEDARRSLLVRLEGEPDGWRRCALAFLEAQTWARELRRIVRAPARESVMRVAEPAVKSAWKLGSWPTVFSMAASFLVAFVLGISLRGGAGSSPEGTQVAGVSESQSGAPSSRPREESLAGGLQQKGNLWGDVRVVGLGPDGAQRAVTVPVTAGEPFDPSWLNEAPPALPEHIQRELVRSGHQLKQQRQILPIELGNGQTVVVPVDQIEVTPVNRRTY